MTLTPMTGPYEILSRGAFGRGVERMKRTLTNEVDPLLAAFAGPVPTLPRPLSAPLTVGQVQTRANRLLAEMPMPVAAPLTLYIAGPMSGLPEWNFPAFFAAQEQLERRGFRVLNPARHAVVEGEPWESCLRRDLPDVLEADGIALLDRWWSSSGARLEVQVASTLLVPCEPVEKWGTYR